MRVSYHWRQHGQARVFDGLRTPLPHPVRPGGDTTVTCTVRAPEGGDLGSWSLVFDVVAEGDRWFGAEATVEVDITTGVRTLLLAGRVDGLVRLESALAARMTLEPGGQLEGMMGDPEPHDQLPAAFERLLDGLPIGGWALDRGVLRAVLDTFERIHPETTIEFGSGTSTVLLAGLARASGGSGGAVVSFEQDPAWAERTREHLAERGLDANAAIVVAALTPVEVGGVKLPSYAPAVVAAALQGRRVDFVVVDGPAPVDGGSRYPTLALVQPHLRGPVPFLLDDAWRDQELTVAEHWSHRPGVEIAGILPVGKGVLVGTISPV
jgi:hypothetical protein